jgi:hypothetical protein
MSIDSLGADESAAARRPALGVELYDPGLDRDAPGPRTNPTIPTPGAPVLQRRRHRCAAATLVEPAASLPGAVQAGRIAAGPADSLLDPSREAGRTSADAMHPASARSLSTLVTDLARVESKVVVIACHGMTIGSCAKACKTQSVRVGAWRRKGSLWRSGEKPYPRATAFGALNTKRKSV